MTARAIQLADAVVAELAAKTDWSWKFTAERINKPSWDLSKGELDKIRVTVSPYGGQPSRSTRSKRQFDYTLHIAVQRRIKIEKDDGHFPNERTDSLIELAQAIDDYLFTKELVDYESASWVGSEWVNGERDIFSEEQLNEHLFMSVLQITYRVWA